MFFLKNFFQWFSLNKKNVSKKIFVLLFFAGCLSSFGFQPHSWIFILFITFGVLFWILNKCSDKKSFFGTGFCFGFGLGACSLSWVANALTIDIKTFGWAIPFVPLGFGLLFGLFYGISTLACYKSSPGWKRLCVFAGAFTLSEWVRSWIFTGFPWNVLGNVWTVFPPVLQTASVLGVFGLSFISIFLFSGLYFLFSRQYKILTLLCVFFLIISSAGAIRLLTAEKASIWGLTVRLVQPAIPQNLKWNADTAEDHLMEHIHLSLSPGAQKITHLIWSEVATPFLLDQDDYARAMTISALHQEETLITGSLRKASSSQLSNSILVINDVGQVVSYYDKSHLVPFGEYVPFQKILPMQKIVPITSDFKAGKGPQTISIPGAPPAGLLVCYEIIFPGNVIDRKYRPDWLINVTNDGWYGLSAGPYQHLAAAQLRAVEEGLPVVRAAGSGISAIINPHGQIEKSLKLGEKGVLDGSVPQKLPPTFYSFYQNSLILFLALVSILMGQIRNKKNTPLHSLRPFQSNKKSIF